MALSATAKALVDELSHDSIKLGNIKKHGKSIKMDHGLALELWASKGHYPRLLATLIFDKKQLTQTSIEQLAADMLTHDASICEQLADWLLANQLMKNKRLVTMLESWQDHPSPVLCRLFWYHQARLRWTGKKPAKDNSQDLINALENNLAIADPMVQWAMNFCAGQIGVHEPELRTRCIQLGQNTGLYKDEPVAKNCTPSYLPEFIRIEVEKRQ